MKAARLSITGHSLTERRKALTHALVLCGMESALLYTAMLFFAALLYEGYNSASQTVSELSAIGAPTRQLWISLGFIYNLLVVAFGWGVWRSAGRSSLLRIAGVVFAVSGLLGFFWPPMHQREVLAAGGGTLTDTLHIAWTVAWGTLSLIAMILGAIALGRRFRVFSIATILVLLVFGILTGLDSPKMEANLPTPWMGVWERINIAAFLVWMIAFAMALLRVPESGLTKGNGTGARSKGKTAINGFVSPGFEGVLDAFAENFRSRNELGGACCIYHRGEKVVDLWGGVRNEATGEPWNEDTMVVVFSATKGMAAMTLAVAHSRGLLDYDERVCAYWPEFAQEGKEKMTVRQLLAHHGGLHAFGEKVDRNLIADPDRFAVVLARQKPEWGPGSRQAYHAISLGFYESELLRRIDPQHRSLGQFFQDEIATPLELDFYIRLPESIPNSRLAVLDTGNPFKALLWLPFPLMIASLNPRSHIFRALMVNPGSWVSLEEERIYARNLEVPSGGGVGTARAIARAYSVFATGGKELGLCADTLQALQAPAIPSTQGFYDEALKGEVRFSLGFMKTCPNWRFGHEGAFGSPGAGGSLGFADPRTGMSYAYVTNRLGAHDGDPRDVALRNAIPQLLVGLA